jgi:uncharacterized repeat protein (TIGR03803 family)
MPKLRISALVSVSAALLALASCGGKSQVSQSQPAFSVLYSFTYGADGANPSTKTMVRDAQGNLYGTTQLAGNTNCNVSLHPGCGTVFRLDTTGILTPLHIFTGGAFDVGGSSGLIQDAGGNLYGTGADSFGNGLVFKVDKNGMYTVFYDFAGGSDGYLPTGYLLPDRTGNIYGTTLEGGVSTDPLCPQGCGTVFELDPTGLHTVVYSFLDNSDGAAPNSLIRDIAGNLYGATWNGGQGCPQLAGCGTIFELDTSGNKTVLHYFTGGADGSTPNGSLALDSAGNLYGTAQAGGDRTCPYNGGAGCGVIFKLHPNGDETVLHAFHGGPDGNVPVAVVLDAAGNLYGTTQSGPNTSVCGTVFKLDSKGNLTNLHNFDSAGSDGCFPGGTLIQDTLGNLYGSTTNGGSNGDGTLFTVKF